MTLKDDAFRNPEDHKVKLVRTVIFLGDEESIRGKINSSANWIIWVMAVSMFNTLMVITKSDIYLNLGLGITFLFDAICSESIRQSTEPGFATFATILNGILDFTVYGIFAFLWVLASRKFYRWALILAATLIGIDSFIFLSIGEFVPVAIHIMAVAFMLSGLSNYKMIKIEKITKVN